MSARAIFAGIVLVTASLLSGCGTKPCDAFAQCGGPALVVVAHLPVPISATPPLSITFCRNGACAAGSLSSSNATLDGAFRVDAVAKAVNDGATDLVLTPAFASYVDGSGDVADGDSYEVRVTSGTSVLVDDTRTIDFAHSSPTCGDPGSCYTASYDVSPP